MKKLLIFLLLLGLLIFNSCKKESPDAEGQKESNETEEAVIALNEKDPVTDPRDRISVNLPSDPREDPDLSGIYTADTGENVYFNHTFKDGKLYLTFLSEDQEPVIDMINWRDEEGVRKIMFQLGDTEIEFEEGAKLSLSQTQDEKLQEFGQSVYAEALANVSAYSYWKIPGRDYNDFRMSFITMYYPLVYYIAPERKQFTQPPQTTDGTCMLDEICQLWHNEGMFGCQYADDDFIDYLPLLDGPPSECVLIESEKVFR